MSAAMSKYRYLAHLTEIATESAQVSGTEKTSVAFPPGFYRFGDPTVGSGNTFPPILTEKGRSYV